MQQPIATYLLRVYTHHTSCFNYTCVHLISPFKNLSNVLQTQTLIVPKPNTLQLRGSLLSLAPLSIDPPLMSALLWFSIKKQLFQALHIHSLWVKYVVIQFLNPLPKSSMHLVIIPVNFQHCHQLLIITITFSSCWYYSILRSLVMLIIRNARFMYVYLPNTVIFALSDSSL